jgi:hypothetical protein
MVFQLRNFYLNRKISYLNTRDHIYQLREDLNKLSELAYDLSESQTQADIAQVQSQFRLIHHFMLRINHPRMEVFADIIISDKFNSDYKVKAVKKAISELNEYIFSQAIGNRRAKTTRKYRSLDSSKTSQMQSSTNLKYSRLQLFENKEHDSDDNGEDKDPDKNYLKGKKK